MQSRSRSSVRDSRVPDHDPRMRENMPPARSRSRAGRRAAHRSCPRADTGARSRGAGTDVERVSERRASSDSHPGKLAPLGTSAGFAATLPSGEAYCAGNRVVALRFVGWTRGLWLLQASVLVMSCDGASVSSSNTRDGGTSGSTGMPDGGAGTGGLGSGGTGAGGTSPGSGGAIARAGTAGNSGSGGSGGGAGGAASGGTEPGDCGVGNPPCAEGVSAGTACNGQCACLTAQGAFCACAASGTWSCGNI